MKGQEESGLTVYNVEEVKNNYQTVQLAPVESIPAHMLKMLESDVHLVCISVAIMCSHTMPVQNHEEQHVYHDHNSKKLVC